MYAPVISVVRGVRMNMEDSRLIAQFQRLTTEGIVGTEGSGQVSLSHWLTRT